MVNVISRNRINEFLWRISFVYIVTIMFVTPLYKFLEVYFHFPGFNFSIFRAALFIIVSFALLFKVRYSYFEKMILMKLFPALVALMTAIVVVLSSYFYVLDYSPNAMLIYLTRIDTSLIGYVMLFIAGFYFDYKSSKFYRKPIITMWIVYSVFVLLNYDILLGSYFTYNESYRISSVNYIFLSDGYLFLSILAISLLEKPRLKVLVWLITIGVMLLMPSRANTMAYILASVFVFYNFKAMFYAVFVFLLVLVYLFFIDSSVLTNSVIFKESRVINFNYNSDTSLKARNEIANLNNENFKNTWFFGDFMGDVRIFGDGGHDTHNVLSRWQQFGIIHFLFFCLSLIIIVYHLFLLKNNKDFIYKSTLMLTFFAFPLILFFRGFEFGLSFFLVSRTIVYYYTIQNSKRVIGTYQMMKNSDSQ